MSDWANEAETVRRYLGLVHPAPGYRGGTRWYLTAEHAKARREKVMAA